MSALAILSPRPNSHPFQERQISVHEPIKIGRSVARARPAPNNAIYDCKVLSRNHALLWYENGKFYLQDTKSSNGTFVNNQRLSKGSEESPPREICSNDLVQFGVDVMENARRVTHSCIIATIQLFHPDGTEATDNHSSPFLNSPASGATVQPQELYQLAQYLQEALHREQMLENKLATLGRLVRTTQEASESGWQALIDEDRLLSRLEILENQLQAYSKNQTEETLRQELVALQEDKHKYETTSKESLRRVLQEKLDAVRKLSDLESSLGKSEDECSLLKSLYDTTKQELQELSAKHEEQTKLIDSLEEKLQEAEKSHQEELDKMDKHEVELEAKIEEMIKQENQLQAKMEVVQAECDFTKEQLANMKAKMEMLKEQVGDSPHIRETENTGIQVDLVNMMDLQLLNRDTKDSDEDSDDDITDNEEDNVEKEELEKLEKGVEKTSQTKEQLKATLTVSDLDLDLDHGLGLDLDLTTLPSEQLKDTQEKIEYYKKQLEESEDNLKASQSRIDTLQSELEEAKMEAVKSEERFSLLEEKLQLPDMHMNQLIENAIADLKIQLSESKKQADCSDELTTELKDQIAELESELAQYKEQNEERSPPTPIVPTIPMFSNDVTNSNNIANHTEDKTTANNLKEEVEQLRGLLEEAKDAQKASEAEVEKHKCKLEEVKLEVKKSSEELESMRQQLTEAQKEAAERAKQVSSLQEQLRQAQQGTVKYGTEDVQQLKSKVKDTQDGDTFFERSPVKVTELSSADTADVAAVKEECVHLKQRIQLIESEIKTSRTENQQLQTEYHRLQKSYNELDQLKATLQDKEMYWKNNLTDAQKEAEQTKEQLVQAQAEIRQLKEQCDQCQQQITELKVELDASVEDYTELAYRSKTLSHAAIVPLLFLLFAVVLAFYPFLSSITATR